jgi:dipeptidyl-peptidase 4
MSARHLFTTILAFMLLPAIGAQAQHAYSTRDYQQAERWMGYNLVGLVQHTVAGISYLPDGRVFYRDPGSTGTAYMIADPAKRSTTPAFDNGKLAEALAAAGAQKVDAARLGVTAYKPDASGGFTITTRSGVFSCDSAITKCSTDTPASEKKGPAGRPRVSDLSPDKKLAAFIKDNNLWVRVVASGQERQLTTDGVKDYGYATDNAGWQHSDAAILVWSAGSKKIATFQQDQRNTGMMYLVPVTNRHPTLETWRYPLLGDKDVTMIERVVIDVDAAKVTRLKMPPDQHRSTLCDDVSCRGGSGWDDVQFSPDGKQLAFVSTSRDHKDEWLRVADTATGEVREVFHEHAPTYYESGQGRVNWQFLPASNEFIWYSERSDWGQLYLYDLTTGSLKTQITHGDGCVTELLHVDEKNRVLYFLASGKERGEDPYFTNLYRVDFDGSHQQLLTPEVADHAVTLAPDAATFVDIYSSVETAQIAVLRDNTGKVLMPLAKQDISQLLVAGWKAPTPITVKARDGVTPLYGFLWKPTTFDETKKYPVVDYIYPGPQVGSCASRSFHTSEHDNQALADLGFVVVCIDGMGTPFRSKSFHDSHASAPQDMGEDTIPDQVAGLKELASRYSWIDLERVGIWGHSGGGNATVSAMFHFPDFFKVGIAESGNHDNRDYEDDWDEKYAGLETIGPKGEDNYEAHANQNYATNLKGHLLLAHGTMDDNVPPSNTLLLVDALIKANKDFDLIMIPNAHHGYGDASPYMTRRRWDYFVRYLADGKPPLNYQMTTQEEITRKMSASGPDVD